MSLTHPSHRGAPLSETGFLGKPGLCSLERGPGTVPGAPTRLIPCCRIKAPMTVSSRTAAGDCPCDKPHRSGHSVVKMTRASVSPLTTGTCFEHLGGREPRVTKGCPSVKGTRGRRWTGANWCQMGGHRHEGCRVPEQRCLSHCVSLPTGKLEDVTTMYLGGNNT